MAKVSITVNGRPYAIACEDGQEPQLRDLAAELNDEVKSLAAAVGQIGDGQLLVITGLSLIDRLNDLRRELTALREQARAGKAADKARVKIAETHAADLESQIVAALKRLEALTASLEATAS